MQLVPPDEEAGCSFGERIFLATIAGVKASIIICHDKRYPELCRLPVLAGARLIIYIASEQWHDDLPLIAQREPAWSQARLEAEKGVYRAQTQARAVENGVWLIKSNVAGDKTNPLRGSHGMSAVIDPTGVVVAEAGMYGEELLVQEIDMSLAQAPYAQKCLKEGFALREMWEETYPAIVTVAEEEEEEEEDQPPTKRVRVDTDEEPMDAFDRDQSAKRQAFLEQLAAKVGPTKASEIAARIDCGKN